MKLNHLVIPYLAILVFMFGGIITSGGIEWYHTLTLPTWNPSAGVIAVVWGIIYACAAGALLTVWNAFPEEGYRKTLLIGFTCSVLLNLVWSVVFFHLHLFALSVLVAFILGVSVLALMIVLYPRSRRAALLLIPYVLWVFFATYLNYVVMTLNS